MLKKDILFGSVVLLLAALFALTGCSQATDSDGGTAVYNENHLFGTADAADVARAVASAKSSGRAVVLTDQLRIVGTAGLIDVADFEDLPVRVEGSITVLGAPGTAVIVNAGRANLSFEENARITVEATGAFIYSGDGEHIYTNTASTGFKVKYVSNPLEGAQGTDAHIAVPSYRLGAPVASHVTNLYVLDTVTVEGSSVAPTGAPGSGLPIIHALGEVDLTGNNSLVIGNNAVFNLTTSAVLTSKVPGGVTIGVPAGTMFPTIKAAVPININLAATSTASILNIQGPEVVTINGATSINTLTITGVDETGRLEVNTPTLTTGADSFVVTNNAGNISFNAPTSIIGGVVIRNNTNTGSISFDTPIFGTTGLTIPNTTPGTNSGDITIKAGTFTGPVNIQTANSGTITIDTYVSAASDEIEAAVTVANNSGTVNLVASALDAAGIVSVPINSGTVNFTKSITLDASTVKSPNNTGVINFQGNVTTSGILGDTTFAVLADKIAGNGKVVFDGLVTLGAAAAIECDVVFNGDATTDDPLYFDGDVTLAYQKTITLGNATAITTLKRGSTILVAETPVLTAASDVEITPDAGAVLTAGHLYTALDGDQETYLGDKTLTLSGAVITSYTGALRIAGGGVFEVAFADGIDLTSGGSLIIDAGGILALANDASGEDFTVIMNTTTITGVNNAQSRLTAVDGPVTLASDKISGSGSTLAIVEGFANTDIFLATGGNFLDIAGANLDLSLNGTLTIEGGTASIVRLNSGANPGKITLGTTFDTSTTTLDTKTLSTGAFDAILGGNGVIRGSIDTESNTGEIGDISANLTGGNLTITGAGAATDAVLSAGVSLQ